jgi:cell division protein FtsW (lipid II flippase)
MKSALARRRRSSELVLGLLAVIIVVSGYILVQLSKQLDLPPDLWFLLAVMIGLFGVAHLGVRLLAPRSDATVLPVVALLCGIGFIMISRLDSHLARTQAVWMGIGVACFVATLALVPRSRVLERYRYTFALLGFMLLVLPLAPGIGATINGARLWVRAGPVNFQPSEIAKVLLVVFFASYLADKRELLSTGSRRVGRLMIPDPKHLLPLVLAWGFSLIIMTGQGDLGSSMLFFAVFVSMLYIATERSAYLLGAAGLFAAASVFAYNTVPHVQVRVSTWINPWPVSQGKGYQLIQSLFAFGSGGFGGTGLGLGSPQKIPNAATDFVFAAVGEELGMLGTIGVLIAFLLLVGAGFRIALSNDRAFTKLFAAGLTALIGIQAFIIIGGVTRLIPLTGITLPFVSYGGSSLVANFVLIALLLRVSDEASAESEAEARTAAVAVASR